MSSEQQPTTSTELARLYEEGKRALSGAHYKKAIRLFDKAIRSFDPEKDSKNDQVVLQCARSAAHFHWKRYQNAIQDAEMAINLNSEWPKGYFRKAEALAELGQRGEALEQYQRAKSLVLYCDFQTYLMI